MNKFLTIIMVLCFQTFIPLSYVGALDNDKLLETSDILKDYLQYCSGSKIETEILKTEYLNFVLLVKGQDLDLMCLQKEYSDHLKLYPRDDFKDLKIEILDQEEENKILITTFARDICVEGCKLSNDTIFFDDNSYLYFYDLYNAVPLDVNYLKNNRDKFLLEFGSWTHTKNVVFNTSTNNFIYLYDGKLELSEDYYIAQWSKGYFPNQGGAYWYNAKRDYKNNIIELFDMKSDNTECVSADKFYPDGEISNFMMKNNIPTFCVAR